ncbi:p-hydroxybenzoic acid efflux pump subunit AaeB [Pseudidiomarina piscicola]|uniref:p-hydroxybenzoic acid efflux pump subunit AaeB n=1 Tax=Pseudidiomarina piscicola TaxID=2614830 RepID=A0A6S6WLC8_9GAMM|nr:FUSC family protein [Pseudidiomarina piscicola]CAB0150865.1 p-hydroxybenzoic acid efflux pump subunit AaeB [Pseudidiomarina piscicola]VZT40370.1 p-hydroxybenzoic acid efflux pump subunit AaeB [Pseudomonas aeruginosa]
MNALTTKFAQLGFDYTRFRFGLRTGGAACLALFFAWALGLEHPQWSAMTVWAVSQPTRGLLLEKAAHRTLGTFVGSIIGILLVLIAGDQVLALGLGLTLWVVLCVYVANLLHGLIAYGAALGGYSASMVALLSRAPEALLPLGIDRMLTVFVGVVAALLVGWLFTYARAEQTLVNKVRRQTVANLKLMAQAFSKGSALDIPFEARLTQLAHLEAQLVEHGTGSPSAHLSAKLLRRLLNSQLGLFAQLRSVEIKASEQVSERLINCANAIASNDPKTAKQQLKETSRALSHTAIRDEFKEFCSAATERLSFRESGRTAHSVRRRSILLHRDWRGAQQAAIRTFLAMTIITLIWTFTGWPQVAFLLLGASVMLSTFSMAENPAKTMYYVFLGQLVAAVVAVLVQGLLWPYTQSILEMLICLMPVMLIGSLALAHNRTAPGALDFHLIFLLLSQPWVPYHFNLGKSVSFAAAVISAPLIAMASYKLVYPTTLKSRQLQLINALQRELDELDQRVLTPQQFNRYRARLYHRLFKLYQMADKLGADGKQAAEHYLLHVQHQVNKHRR